MERKLIEGYRDIKDLVAESHTFVRFRPGFELAARRPGINLKHLVDGYKKMLYESLGISNCASAQEMCP